MKKERLKKDVIERYSMVDLFILLMDRDSLAGREQSATQLETDLTAELIMRDGRFVVELVCWVLNSYTKQSGRINFAHGSSDSNFVA